MKATELRICNLINYLGDYVEIDSISRDKGDSSLFYISTVKSGIMTNHAFKPIPLTEEWFWKAGFFKEGHPLVDEGWMFSKDKFCSFIKKENYWIPTPKYFNENLKLKYVHQLQNLYYALTGKELTDG